MNVLNCPKGHGPMAQKMKKQKTFKGIDIEYSADAFICQECGIEAGTVQSAGDVQRAIADAYRKKIGLLTGQGIRSLWEDKELTQQQLADVMDVGIASIKRWETVMIQTKSMDHALRIQLQCAIRESDVKDAELLSQEELRVIHQVAEKFPNKRQVYDAAHREKIWLESKTGALIPYSCANELTEF